MKDKIPAQKTKLIRTQNDRFTQVTGDKGVAVDPPAYGLEVLDNPPVTIQAKRGMIVPKEEPLPQTENNSVQMAGPPDRIKTKPTEIHNTARQGVQGSGQKLPYLDKIQTSFGPHNIGHAQAYTDSKAATASRKIGAEAYTMGHKVAFATPSPDLSTVAHEATHIVQQQAGVQLKDGIGQSGDVYEQQAEAVARGVEQGQSVAPLLDKGVANATFASSTPPIQRKIGAEIEIVGAQLNYDTGTGAVQGEKVGEVVSGISTEIHLEHPEDDKTGGYATLELATGLHDQLTLDNPLSLAANAGFLASWIDLAEIYSNDNKVYLKDVPYVKLEKKWAQVNDGKGPLAHFVEKDPMGAFQVNVSPTKETSSAFLDAFDDVFSYEYYVSTSGSKGLYQELASSDFVEPEEGTFTRKNNDLDKNRKDAKEYSLKLYNRIIQELDTQLKLDNPPSILKSVLKALISVPRALYYKRLLSFNDENYEGTEKNILDLLPRANIRELWEKVLGDDSIKSIIDSKLLNQALPKILESAIMKTKFVGFEGEDIVNPEYKGDIDYKDMLLKFNRMMDTKVYDMDLLTKVSGAKTKGHIISGPPAHASDMQLEFLTNMLAVIQGKKVLIKPRGVETKTPSILANTDSGLIPVNEEQGEAGVYEIRNPFTKMLAPKYWEDAITKYEQMLREKGVRY